MDSHMFDGLVMGLIVIGVVVGLAVAGLIYGIGHWLLPHIVLGWK